MTLHEGIHSQAGRANLVKVLFCAFILLDGIRVLSGFQQYSLLSRAGAGLPVTQAEAQASDLGVAFLAVIYGLLYLGTVVAWLFWLHRAYGNLLLMGEGKTDYTPGWSVGCWFVPVLNLFRPYQMVKELWQRSARGNIKQELMTLLDSGTPGIFPLWWGLWLASNFLGNIEFRLAGAVEGVNQLQMLAALRIFSSFVGIGSAWAALQVVRRIDSLQRAAGAAPAQPAEVGLTFSA